MKAKPKDEDNQEKSKNVKTISYESSIDLKHCVANLRIRDESNLLICDK